MFWGNLGYFEVIRGTARGHVLGRFGAFRRVSGHTAGPRLGQFGAFWCFSARGCVLGPFVAFWGVSGRSAEPRFGAVWGILACFGAQCGAPFRGRLGHFDVFRGESWGRVSGQFGAFWCFSARGCVLGQFGAFQRILE